MKIPVRTWLRGATGWRPGADLPLTDRGARYGMAVFETIGVRCGQPILRGQHLGLLAESAHALLGAAPPDDLPPLEREDTGVLRLYVTAGDGAPAAPVENPRHFALFEASGPAALPAEQSARLQAEPAAPFAHGRKTANYWMNCAAQAEAQAAGFDHAILSDPGGRLLSAAFANLFLVLDGALCTPSAGLAVRPGVIRDWILRRQPVREVEWPAERLGEASEIFLTNSRLGVMPLRCGAVAPGPVGRSLREAALREKLVP